jgi:hypothetical protein
MLKQEPRDRPAKCEWGPYDGADYDWAAPRAIPTALSGETVSRAAGMIMRWLDCWMDDPDHLAIELFLLFEDARNR